MCTSHYISYAIFEYCLNVSPWLMYARICIYWLAVCKHSTASLIDMISWDNCQVEEHSGKLSQCLWFCLKSLDIISLKKNFFFHVKLRVQGRQGDTERDLCLLVHSPRWLQDWARPKSGASARIPIWVAGAQTLGPSAAAAVLRPLPGSWMGSAADGTWHLYGMLVWQVCGPLRWFLESITPWQWKSYHTIVSFLVSLASLPGSRSAECYLALPSGCFLSNPIYTYMKYQFCFNKYRFKNIESNICCRARCNNIVFKVLA